MHPDTIQMVVRHAAIYIAAQMDVPLRRIYWVRQKLRKRFGGNTNEHLISMAVAEGFTSTNH